MKIVMVLGTDRAAVRSAADSTGLWVAAFPEAGHHASTHGRMFDELVESRKSGDGLAIATHSRELVARFFLRVMEDKISPADVEVIWADTGRVMKVTASGAIEGGMEDPSPLQFGEEEYVADMKAMKMANAIRQSRGQPMKIVQQQKIDARTGQVLEEVKPEDVVPLEQQVGLDGKPLGQAR